ncbi:hypothetical protein KFU94_35695 [Chloroflexi bacterium TSY]|nr:hypothetical protein [Chloroflexi bacterium TSY]
MNPNEPITRAYVDYRREQIRNAWQDANADYDFVMVFIGRTIKGLGQLFNAWAQRLQVQENRPEPQGS